MLLNGKENGEHMDPIVDLRYDTVGNLQYRTANVIALGPWITVGANVGTVPVPPLVGGGYTKEDIVAREFPIGSQWLIADLHGAPYLQGRCWWLLEEMAKAEGVPLIVLQGCPLSVPFAGSPAHHPCNEPGGGMMADCKYPSINGVLDIAKMEAMMDRFLFLCAKYPPGQEWKDVSNESEIQVGGDVFELIKNKYVSGQQVNRHLKYDDDFHHRYDDTLYPHFHLKWSIA